jgi:hypothetical protein
MTWGQRRRGTMSICHHRWHPMEWRRMRCFFVAVQP